MTAGEERRLPMTMHATDKFCIPGDFHSHILPGMDDGAPDTAVSIEMLTSLAEQNVETACLTPHYNHHRESVAAFLERRAQACESLQSALREQEKETSVPALKLGAEVRLETGLLEDSDLPGLCYEGTRAILLEFPFEKLERRIYEELENLTLRYRMTPVIAHFERYQSLFSKEDKEKILSLPRVVIQINAESVCTFSGKKFFFSLLEREIPVIIGSDAHDTKERPPQLEKAYQRVMAKLDDYGRNVFLRTAKDIFC